MLHVSCFGDGGSTAGYGSMSYIDTQTAGLPTLMHDFIDSRESTHSFWLREAWMNPRYTVLNTFESGNGFQ